MCKLSLPAALATAQQYQQPQYPSQLQQQSQQQHAQCKLFYFICTPIFLKALLAWQSEDKYYCINVTAHVTDEIRKG